MTDHVDDIAAARAALAKTPRHVVACTIVCLQQTCQRQPSQQQ
jgi:hypothetical protein